MLYTIKPHVTIDEGQRRRSINGAEFEQEIHFKINEIITKRLDSAWKVYLSGKKWQGLPDSIKNKLRIPRNNKPSSVTAEPDCDVVLCYVDDPRMVFHCRRNLREVEKNSEWVNRMRKYKPTSHILHFVMTKDVDSELQYSKRNNKSRDMASHYDATYSTNENIIFESPFVMEDREICRQIVRKFSNFEKDIVDQLNLTGKVDLTLISPSLSERYDAANFFKCFETTNEW